MQSKPLQRPGRRYAACMTLRNHLRQSLQQEMRQSLAVLTRPSVGTFELFEQKGMVQDALLYVLLAALASGVVAALMALITAPDHSAAGQFVGRLFVIPLQFIVFTGFVYLVGRFLFKATGRFSEVAYTFALFFVPISILTSALGWIPFVGLGIGMLSSLALVFYGYLAVQSSLNIVEKPKAAVVLLLAALLSTLFNYALFGAPLA